MDGMRMLIDADVPARLTRRDPSLYSNDVDAHQAIRQRLGWTDLAEKAASRLPQVTTLASAMLAEGVEEVILLGMGGSSLAPLVLASAMGRATEGSRLRVLDTTSPVECTRLLDSLNPCDTAFVLASKSGTTVEPLSLYAIFRERMDDALGRVGAGKRFVVITDPGSELELLRRQHLMRIALLAPPTVGGRFSALSLFGLGPAALAGLDISGLVRHAMAAERACHDPTELNPAAQLAAWIADAYANGRDKLTLCASPRYVALTWWIEQLIAESTGKSGVGIVPIIEDGSVRPSSYGTDRALVIVREPGDDTWDSIISEAREVGVPVIELPVAEPSAIGAEFVRWTFATGMLGYLLGVNPFDEPDVARAKVATRSVLEGSAHAPRACADLDGIWPTMAGCFADRRPPSLLDGALAPLAASLRHGDYLAILAYLPYDEGTLAEIQTAAARVSALLRIPVSVNLGPRYLHSTGQLHKGGPSTAAFLMLTTRDRTDVAIPRSPYTLARLFRAQAEGDLLTLSGAGRRIVRLDLPSSERADVERVLSSLVSVANNSGPVPTATP